ncbi:FUSC family protein, partial [Rhizobium ruizarguesonis]
IDDLRQASQRTAEKQRIPTDIVGVLLLEGFGAPETIFDTALARSEEIIIGITCARIVSDVVFPASVRTVLGGRIVSWFDD